MTPTVRPSREALPWIAASLVAALHFGSFDILRQPILWDMRYYLYFAYRTAVGDVPYRDFFENKTPLSIFTGALLYRLGDAFGVDPLHAIRAGYLAFAAAAAVLLFAVHRRLGNGRVTPGLLALLVGCGFPLLGLYPAIGVIPKLLMALFAAAAALLVDQRRWVWAGAAAVLAALDWQVGGLALLGVLLAALATPGGRGRAAAAASAGALVAGLPLLAYFTENGALGAFLGQAVGLLFASSEASVDAGLAKRLARVAMTVRYGSGSLWLVAAGAIGLAVFPRWMGRLRRRGHAGLGLSLAVYHYGVVAFSFVDYQSYGDLFILLHSVAFFAAVAIVEAYRAALALASRRSAGRRRGIVAAAAVVAMATLVGPSFLRPDFSPRDTVAAAHPGASLEDQRSVLGKVTAATAGETTAFVGSAELLFLGRRKNVVPFAYWNQATYRYYRTWPREPYARAMRRMLTSYGAKAVVFSAPAPRPVARADDVEIASADGAYAVTLRHVRDLP